MTGRLNKFLSIGKTKTGYVFLYPIGMFMHQPKASTKLQVIEKNLIKPFILGCGIYHDIVDMFNM